jgi:predicted DNA-binding WGR domain protein
MRLDFERGTRHYALLLQRDLLGDWTVVKVFGRKGSAKGQIRVVAFGDEETARRYFEAECERRVKRGYSPANRNR